MFRLLFLFVIFVGLSGCGLTRDIEIRQGHEEFTEEKLRGVEGLNSEQVRQRLGPPQSRWNLENQVWIYYYRIKNRSTERWQTVVIEFDANLVAKEVRFEDYVADE